MVWVERAQISLLVGRGHQQHITMKHELDILSLQEVVLFLRPRHASQWVARPHGR